VILGRRQVARAPRDEDRTTAAVAAAGDSLSMAGWTLVSRVTGVLRIAAIGAVLGPTLLGNTFQFTNSLPNLVYYGFLAGSLFSSLLVPSLVVTTDAARRQDAARIAGGFLGVALVTLVGAACAAVAVGPLLLRLGTLGTQTQAVGAAQERVGRLLLLMVIPQVLLYAVVATSTAVMNARRRFSLAAAAPALENLGILVVLGAVAVVFGTAVPIDAVPGEELVLLGAGATGAVAVHAAVQWWGARRAGITILPRAGWRDPDVTALVRRALPALALAGLAASQLLGVLVLSNRVAGGVVAAQMGLTFLFFAVALAAAPVGLSLLPRLARLHADGDLRGFRDTLVRGVALVLFVTVPAAVGYVVLARPLAEVVAVGQMGLAAGVQLVATTIAAVAPGVVGEGLFQVLTQACYARGDPLAPLRSMAVQAASFMVLASSALVVDPTAVPVVLGLSFSAATLVGAWHLAARLRRSLGQVGGQLAPCIRRVAAGTALMAVPAWAVGVVVPRWVDGRPGYSIAVVTAVVLGAAVFFLLQAWWRAPELALVTAALGRSAPRVVAPESIAAGGDRG
jgi:putative peptidoglycan lipid II flippase